MPKRETVLITGVSSGIGMAAAELLSEAGFEVYGTSRYPEKAQSTGFELLTLDVRSGESVRACFKEVLERTGQLDVLINNAGCGLKGAAEEVTAEEAKGLFETNFFGVVRTVKAALPVMRRQGGGRIINVSSVAGWMCAPFSGLYCASKHALEGYTEALRYEVARFGIKVSLVEPGYVRTNFTKAAGKSTAQLDVYADPKQATIDYARKSLRNAPGPDAVANKIFRIIRSKSPRLRYTAGKDAALAAFIKKWLPAWLLEMGIRMRFRL